MKEMDLHFFIGILLQRWKVLLITAIAVAACTFGVTKYLVKPSYESSVTLFFGRIMDAGTDANNTYSGDYTRSLSIGLQLANDYRELLNTNHVKQSVLDYIQKEHGVIGEPEYDVNVSLVRQTRVLKVTVTTKNPELSMQIADAFSVIFMQETKKILGLQNAQIIDPALLPEKPCGPAVLKFTAVGFIFGFLICFGLFILLALLDNTVKSSDQIAEDFEQPIIGTIPENEDVCKDNFKGNYIVSIAEGAVADRSSESYRSSRVNLEYSGFSKENEARVIVVTSSIAAEGKSFNSSNLAASLAESGKKVLLINCDLRKPTLQKMFQKSSAIGLTNYLVGEKSVDEIKEKNLLDLPLDVIFCGPVPPNPSRLLTSEQFDKLIEAQRKEYDYIILDTPPILETSDAANVGRCCDGVLLVVRANYTHTKLIRETITQIKQMKLNLLGVLLNRSASRKLNGYGYGYGYGYGAGHKNQY